MTVGWGYLCIAGILEICWVIGLKYTNGFKEFWPSVFTFITAIASMYCLSESVKTIPIGTAYAIWVGIGAFGAALFGMLLFEESASLLRFIFLAFLSLSILGLKFTS